MLSTTVAILGTGEQKNCASSSDDGAAVLVPPATPPAYETNVDSC